MTETESVVTQARENGAVVVATDVTRRYGAGDTAVDALRGVSVSVPSGALTAVMGPSGSGKSTLMHILAGLDQPTSGSVRIAGTEITDLGDNDLTRLRREHIGFVFQFFNLLPMLTAEENILLPLSIAGEKPDPDWYRRPDQVGRSRRPPASPARRALGRPAAAGRDRPSARLAPVRHLRRRADRQPRLDDERRDSRASPPLGARPRPDDGDGHARRARSRRSPTASCSSPTASSSRSRPARARREILASMEELGAE